MEMAQQKASSHAPGHGTVLSEARAHSDVAPHSNLGQDCGSAEVRGATGRRQRGEGGTARTMDPLRGLDEGLVKRQRRYKERSDVRQGFGGSSTHLDGMGTLTALGGVKCGSKMVTAVEACDAPLALHLAKFKMYAKPGGSSFLINDPVDRAMLCFEEVQSSVKDVWTRHGVRWGTFRIYKGEGYAIAAGIPHEFLNVEKALSVAWNIVPACEQAQTEALPWMLLQRSLLDARRDLAGSQARFVAAVDHAPASILLRNAFPFVMCSHSLV